MIDPEKLFSVFEIPTLGEEGVMDFQKTQAFKLGMFKKIIWNQKNIEARMEHFFQMMPELAEKVAMDENSSEFVTHLRAWSYLKDFDPSTEQGKDALRIFSDQYTLTACDLAISFWEDQEEYEKCAHIKKVKDSLKIT